MAYLLQPPVSLRKNQGLEARVGKAPEPLRLTSKVSECRCSCCEGREQPPCLDPAGQGAAGCNRSIPSCFPSAQAIPSAGPAREVQASACAVSARRCAASAFDDRLFHEPNLTLLTETS